MPRKFLYILTILIAALSLTFTACETDEDEDATDSGSTGATPAGGMTTTGATPAGGATGGDTPTAYRFIRITDLSNDTGGDAPGADGDAVGVRSAATGMTQWAATVEGTAGVDFTGDTNAILGEPDAFADWASGDLSNCSTDETANLFTSFGGSGSIVVGFANDFVAGDTIEFYEVGNCASTSAPGVEARPEEVTIEVAVTGDIASASWQPAAISNSAAPLITATVP